jgi:hypothetical protein
MANRGVSEVVGFVLVFALITSTTGLLYVSGIADLEDRRDAERVNNAERAFNVLANNIERVATGRAPSRATEIKLAEAQLRLGEPTSISVSVDDSLPRGPDSISPIVYDAGTSSQVVYESGAVIRVDGANAIMKYEPNMLFSDARTVIQLTETVAGGSGSMAGSTTTLVRTERASSSVLFTREGSPTVTLRIKTTPARAGAWKRYLDNQIGPMDPDACEPGTTQTDVSAGVVECKFETEQLYAVSVSVDTEFN